MTSERVATLSWTEEVFYRRLMSVVDDFGRFYAMPSLIRAACYPLALDKVTDADIGKWLLVTEKAGLVSVYPALDGKRYFQISDFRQQLRSEPKFPGPEGDPHQPKPKCVAGAQQVISVAHLGVGGVGDEVVAEGVGGNGARAPEVLPKEQAVAQCANVGAQASFAGYVYDDWATRGGKDAAGNLVPWVKYLAKRWSRERGEWMNGVHKGRKSTQPHRTV